MSARRDLFRTEAWQAQERAGRDGALLRLPAGWINRGYWLLLLFAAAAVSFSVFARVAEHARGPAVIRALAENDGPVRGSGFTIIAFLPARWRPLLRPGLPLRVFVAAQGGRPTSLAIESVEDRILSPSQLRRHLGADLAEAFSGAGPGVLVRARVPAGGNPEAALPLFDGMPAQAEVEVRTSRLLATLIPALEPS